MSCCVLHHLQPSDLFHEQNSVHISSKKAGKRASEQGWGLRYQQQESSSICSVCFSGILLLARKPLCPSGRQSLPSLRRRRLTHFQAALTHFSCVRSAAIVVSPLPQRAERKLAGILAEPSKPIQTISLLLAINISTPTESLQNTTKPISYGNVTHLDW